MNFFSLSLQQKIRKRETLQFHWIIQYWYVPDHLESWLNCFYLIVTLLQPQSNVRCLSFMILVSQTHEFITWPIEISRRHSLVTGCLFHYAGMPDKIDVLVWFVECLFRSYFYKDKGTIHQEHLQMLRDSFLPDSLANT